MGFEAVLSKIDLNQYLKQREFEENLKSKLAEYEEKTKADIDTKLAEIETENEENADEIKLFKKYHHVIQATQFIWSLITNHVMKPLLEQASYCRIIAAFIRMFVGDKLSLVNAELTQLDVISNAAWNQCLMCLEQITLKDVVAFNPNESEVFDVMFVEKLIDGVNGEEIGSEGLAMIITMLFQFVDASCKLFKFVVEEDKKKKEEEEKKANEPENQEEDAEADAA